MLDYTCKRFTLLLLSVSGEEKISFMTLSPEQPLVAAGAETTSAESVTITSSSEHAETPDSGVDQVPMLQNILQSYLTVTLK
jgi:hypothetical protein